MNHYKELLIIYLKSCGFLAIVIGVLGFLDPYLFSQPDTSAVLLGVIATTAVIPGAVALLANIGLSIHHLQHKEQMRNENTKDSTSDTAGNTGSL